MTSLAEYAITKDSKLEKTIEFTITKAQIDELFSQEFVKITKNINLPGFRKGHVPSKLVEEKYGDGIRVDCFEKVLNNQIQKIVTELSLKLADRPRANFDHDAILKNGDVSIKVDFDLFPEIPEINLSNILVNTYKIKVEQKDIEQGVEAFRKKHATKYDVIIDRASQPDDSLDINFVGSINGVEFKGGAANNHNIIIGSKTFIDGFEDQLIGRKAGEEFDVHVTFPQNYGSAELAGKPAVFKVKVNSISAVSFEELTDELVKKNTQLETIEAFKEDIKKNMDKYYQGLIRDAIRPNILDLVAAALDFDVPEVFLQRAVEMSKKSKLEANALLPEGQRKTEEEIVKEIRTLAKKDIMLTLFTRELAEKNPTEVSEQDMYEFFITESSKVGVSPFELMQEFYKNPDNNELKSIIKERKIYETIYDTIAKNFTEITVKELENLIQEKAPLTLN